MEMKWEWMEVKLTVNIYSNLRVIGLNVGIFIPACMMVMCEYVFLYTASKLSKQGLRLVLCASLGA